MRLVSVASLAKVKFLANLSKSKTFYLLILSMLNQKYLAFKRDFSGEFWTSGHRSEEYFEWMAKKRLFEQSEIKWWDGEPSENGDCVFLSLKNSTENSWVSTANCAERKKFICEVLFWLLTWHTDTIMKNNL
jgi:hypothetical protein